MLSNTITITSPNLGQKPSQAALQNWKDKVALLSPWEQEEINNVYQQLTSLLNIYQSSAALAIVRAALEVGLAEGQ